MRKTLVVMIHGLTGGENTWKNEESGARFPELLESDAEIKESFKFVEFDYFTEIINFTQNIIVRSLVGLVNSITRTKFTKPKIRKNSSIESLTNSLATFLEAESEDYDGIVLIGHSMGGLIAKNFILKLSSGEYEDLNLPVIGYISLATPHRGSFPAMILGSINLNAKELQPLNADMTILNDQWVENFDNLPRSYYLEAQHDECVGNIGSTPNTNKKFKSSTLPVSHTEICKPKDSKDLTFKIVKKYLLDIIHINNQEKLTQVEYDPNIYSYDKEIFVVKMVLASIEERLIEDAKESFFHAELIMKSAKRQEVESFNELKIKIISLYKTFSSCSDSKSSSEIVKEIHSNIIKYDKTSLYCLVNYINFLHKKGILHQEANKLNLNINWSSDVTLNNLKAEVE